ncbi:hypothetical protein [Malonomonas rubra]|uniref:hypothetical protein n=1 Tax=Malonomonas rubra TaxID=57040 RepID=UPI0026EF9EC8|nr:hypothetical protein [Malonomonas rubra]
MSLGKRCRVAPALVLSLFVFSFLAFSNTQVAALGEQPIYSPITECADGNCSGYTNSQVSFNDYHDKLPKINDYGDVVWQGRSASEDYEIFFKAGDSMIIEQITENEFDDIYPMVNDLGEITWMGHNGTDWDIYLNSSGNSTKISHNTMDDLFPKINNLGDVVWLAVDGHDYEIYQYSSGNSTQITDNEVNDVQVRLNDSGDIMWRSLAEMSSDIFLHSGTETTQINSDDLFDHNPQLNNNADLVWEVADGNDCEIVVKLASDPVPVQITDNETEDWFPMINSAGVVVWQGSDGNDFEIYAYSNGVISQITDNDFDDLSPQINDTGDIAWLAMGDATSGIGIYLYQTSNQTISKLSDTFTGHYDSVPDINNDGKIVWSGWDGNDFEIITASAPNSVHDDVYFQPRTVNLQSGGKGFAAVIDLPLPYSAADIDPASVAITMISSGDAPSSPLVDPLYSTGKYKVGDFDDNGIVEMIISFDRQALIQLLEPLGIGVFDLSIAGKLYDGTTFPGVNSIKVVDQKSSKLKIAKIPVLKLKEKTSKN